MSYVHFYGDGLGGFTNEFRERHQIPDDVLVERYTKLRFTYEEDFRIFPLFALTEGGVRFPLNPFYLHFFDSYELVGVNLYMILSLAI